MKVALQNLSKRFGRNRVLNSVDLELPEGAIVALVGINGAGKSTLLHCMAVLTALNNGSITFDGEVLRRDRIDLRRRFMFLADFPVLTRSSTLVDYLGFVLRLYERETQAATEAVLEGAEPSQATADRAAETLAGELRPIDDVRSTADYRRMVAARVLHRLVREAGGW